MGEYWAGGYFCGAVPARNQETDPGWVSYLRKGVFQPLLTFLIVIVRTSAFPRRVLGRRKCVWSSAGPQPVKLSQDGFLI